MNWTLLTKLPKVAALEQFPEATYIGPTVLGGTHPTGPYAGNSTNNLHALSICSDTKPNKAKDGSYWFAGLIGQYDTFSVNRENLDPTCCETNCFKICSSSIKELALEISKLN